MNGCVYCGKTVDESHGYRRVVGWERKAVGSSRKGGSDIFLREHRDEFACGPCIARMKLGLSVAQESLL